MSAAKHTPGPLEVRTAGKTPAPCVFTVAGLPVARCERVEDAYLFAAAPDLLAALRRLLGSYEVLASSDPDMPSHAETEREAEAAEDAARAAIARAEGRAT